jgi:hypothetical protein
MSSRREEMSCNNTESTTVYDSGWSDRDTFLVR